MSHFKFYSAPLPSPCEIAEFKSLTVLYSSFACIIKEEPIKTPN